VSVSIVNVVVKMKLPGRIDLTRLAASVPGSNYEPGSFPAAVVMDYEHDEERVSFLVFSSGAVGAEALDIITS
jgi:TATA-box binding protein (TBP) (component of TFIID and TFIIIB)